MNDTSVPASKNLLCNFQKFYFDNLKNLDERLQHNDNFNVNRFYVTLNTNELRNRRRLKTEPPKNNVHDEGKEIKKSSPGFFQKLLYNISLSISSSPSKENINESLQGNSSMYSSSPRRIRNGVDFREIEKDSSNVSSKKLAKSMSHVPTVKHERAKISFSGGRSGKTKPEEYIRTIQQNLRTSRNSKYEKRKHCHDATYSSSDSFRESSSGNSSGSTEHLSSSSCSSGDTERNKTKRDTKSVHGNLSSKESVSLFQNSNFQICDLICDVFLRKNVKSMVVYDTGGIDIELIEIEHPEFLYYTNSGHRISNIYYEYDDSIKSREDLYGEKRMNPSKSFSLTSDGFNGRNSNEEIHYNTTTTAGGRGGGGGGVQMHDSKLQRKQMVHYKKESDLNSSIESYKLSNEFKSIYPVRGGEATNNSSIFSKEDLLNGSKSIEQTRNIKNEVYIQENMSRSESKLNSLDKLNSDYPKGYNMFFSRSTTSLNWADRKRKKYQYVGETYNNKRNGWGMLIYNDRVIFEGQYKMNSAIGYFIKYNEYSTEIGYRSPIGIHSVTIMSDNDNFIVQNKSDEFDFSRKVDNDIGTGTGTSGNISADDRGEGTSIEMKSDSVSTANKDLTSHNVYASLDEMSPNQILKNDEDIIQDEKLTNIKNSTNASGLKPKRTHTSGSSDEKIITYITNKNLCYHHNNGNHDLVRTNNAVPYSAPNKVCNICNNTIDNMDHLFLNSMNSAITVNNPRGFKMNHNDDSVENEDISEKENNTDENNVNDNDNNENAPAHEDDHINENDTNEKYTLSNKNNAKSMNDLSQLQNLQVSSSFIRHTNKHKTSPARSIHYLKPPMMNINRNDYCTHKDKPVKSGKATLRRKQKCKTTHLVSPIHIIVTSMDTEDEEEEEKLNTDRKEVTENEVIETERVEKEEEEKAKERSEIKEIPEKTNECKETNEKENTEEMKKNTGSSSLEETHSIHSLTNNSSIKVPMNQTEANYEKGSQAMVTKENSLEAQKKSIGFDLDHQLSNHKYKSDSIEGISQIRTNYSTQRKSASNSSKIKKLCFKNEIIEETHSSNSNATNSNTKKGILLKQEKHPNVFGKSCSMEEFRSKNKTLKHSKQGIMKHEIDSKKEMEVSTRNDEFNENLRKFHSMKEGKDSNKLQVQDNDTYRKLLYENINNDNFVIKNDKITTFHNFLDNSKYDMRNALQWRRCMTENKNNKEENRENNTTSFSIKRSESELQETQLPNFGNMFVRRTVRGATFPETYDDRQRNCFLFIDDYLTSNEQKFNVINENMKLRASDYNKWSNNMLCTFLKMIGLQKEAYLFKINKIRGYHILKLTDRELKSLNIRNGHVRKFLLSVFRFLVNSIDNADPLSLNFNTSIRFSFDKIANIESHEIHILKKVGGGSYAQVFRAKYKGSFVACKIFLYNPKQMLIDEEDPSCESYISTPRSSQNYIIPKIKMHEHMKRNSSEIGEPKAGVPKEEEKPKCTLQMNKKVKKMANLEIFRYFPTPVKYRNYEAKILYSLQSCKHVIKLHGVCSVKEGEESLVLQYCPGGSLEKYIYYDERGYHSYYLRKFSRPQIVKIFQQVAEGMHYIHSRNYFHRDLKLSNILIDEHDNAVISDFGLSTSFSKNDCPSAYAIYGNIFYAAPEVLKGEGFFKESDVWSFAVSLWEALTKQIAYDGFTSSEVYAKISAGELKLPIPNHIPMELSKLLLSMLEFDFTKRPLFHVIAKKLKDIRISAEMQLHSDIMSFFNG